MDCFDTDELEYQIIGRVPLLQTLDRCKFVCKRWSNIINEASFMPTYCRNTGNLYGFILQYQGSKGKFSKSFLSVEQNDYKKFIPSNTDLNFDPDVEIIASSMQGILFCINMQKQEFYVCKQMTGQWEKIPKPTTYYTDRAGFIILSNMPLCYKIVRIWRRDDAHSSESWRMEIFDSKIWKWGVSVELSLPFTVGCGRFNHKQGIQVGRFLYFIMDTFILLVHGIDENSFLIQLPQSLSLIDQNAHSRVSTIVKEKLTEYQGSLGFIRMTWTSFTTMELWILEDQELTVTWKKIKEVDMRVFGLKRSCGFYPLGFYNGDILVFRMYGGSFILCNFQDFTYEEFKHNNTNTLQDSYPFRSDQEPVDLIHADHRGVKCIDYIHWGLRKIGNALLLLCQNAE